jgi:hypothetical protein
MTEESQQPSRPFTSKILVEGEDYYRNEEGFVVLTELHHLRRGYCCGMACLHCPYQYESVTDEQKKEEAIARRNYTSTG